MADELESVQALADRTLVNGLDDGHPLLRALAHFDANCATSAHTNCWMRRVSTGDNMPRWSCVASTALSPGMAERNESDLAAALAMVAAADRPDLALVVVVGDGRDIPARPVRSCSHVGAARVRVATVSVGEHQALSDAVIGEIAAPDEVFRGESVPISFDTITRPTGARGVGPHA